MALKLAQLDGWQFMMRIISWQLLSRRVSSKNMRGTNCFVFVVYSPNSFGNFGRKHVNECHKQTIVQVDVTLSRKINTSTNFLCTFLRRGISTLKYLINLITYLKTGYRGTSAQFQHPSFNVICQMFSVHNISAKEIHLI